MDDANGSQAALQAAAGQASEQAVEAFELLGNETRLAIVLALWEAFEPFSDEAEVSFSELRDRVGIRQGAQFNYHLDKLVGEFIEKKGDGYVLGRRGHQIVRTVIAGTGIDTPSNDLQEIGIDCPLCDASTAVTYRDEWLYIVCTECEGYFEGGSNSPEGMLSGTEFDPAGLTNRDAEQQWRTGWLIGKNAMQLAAEGVCNECSGTMEGSVDVCDEHDADGPCDECGRRTAVMVRFRCPVCKNHHNLPPRTLIIHHPAVIAFYYDRGVNFQYDDGSIESFYARSELIADHEQELVSTNPFRVRVSITYDDDELRLTLDKNLDVVDVTSDTHEQV